jgi:hypothetical protein
MPTWKEGDRVRIVERKVTEEDRKQNRYFDHMAGLTGTVQNIYSDKEVAIKVDDGSMTKVSTEVHKTANKRLREKFLANVSEEQKKLLTPEELNFDMHYVLLVDSKDLEKAK